MNLELNINELVLHGFALGDRYLISAAIEQELTRLLAERGAPTLLQSNGDFAKLSGGQFQTTPGMKANAIGAQVAQAVYGGMQSWVH